MKKIVECVPNFSEGRNKNIIDAISDSIRAVEGVTLLDVDPGKSTNRTVYTFVGDPEAIVEGALAATRTAKKLIDMSKQTGEHPRMGAMDVCPFVPVANVSMEECVEISKIFAKRAAEELNVPFYLYEHSQEREYRKKLPHAISSASTSAKRLPADWTNTTRTPRSKTWALQVCSAANLEVADGPGVSSHNTSAW